LWLFSRTAPSPRLFAVSQKFAAMASRLFSPFSSWIRLPAATGWGYSKDFPRFARKTFRERYQARKRKTIFDLEKKEDMATAKQDELSAIPPVQVQDRVAQFSRELAALGGQVRQVENVTDEVIAFLQSRNISKIHLESDVLDETRLQDAGIRFTHVPDPAMRVGVTKAVCGLADTGSILEADGPGYPLQASLLPEIHIAVLNQLDILPSLPDAMPLVKDKNAAVFITGPSRTSDIEMSLTIGVHGPGEIHVLITPQ
jgi:L-lactate utilization protein LutC